MKCNLRQWSIEDASCLAKILNNKKIQNNLRDGIPYPYTENDAKDFITAMHNADKNTTFAFAISVDNRAVGSISAFRKDNIHAQTAEIGYYLAESYWGQGIGTEAVKQICHYLFENTNIIRISALAFAHNEASCHILEKCGFECEGILRRNAVKNGIVLDMKIFALLKAGTVLDIKTALS